MSAVHRPGPGSAAGQVRTFQKERDMVFDAGDRVTTTRPLPGVPGGSRGVATVAVGLAWKRCRVRFESGTEVGSLDDENLARTGR